MSESAALTRLDRLERVKIKVAEMVPIIREGRTDPTQHHSILAWIASEIVEGREQNVDGVVLEALRTGLTEAEMNIFCFYYKGYSDKMLISPRGVDRDRGNGDNR